jgi:hypothetical protein
VGRRNIPEHLKYYFTFVQADRILKNNWNLTSAFVLLLGFGLRADVFQNPQLLKYVYVGCYGRKTEPTDKTDNINKKFN